MSLFITGTDTGVGKTVVSALLLARYAAELELAYWKPVATGAVEERDSLTVAALVPASVEVRLELHLLRDPVSPHLAARREGIVIDLDEIAAAWERWQTVSPERAVVIEGAGGVMVPLNEKPSRGELLIDLMALLELPVLLVARSTLGTINHTLLTLDALRRRGIPVAGVVLNGPADDENCVAIEAFGEVSVVSSVLPFELSEPGMSAAAAGFDPRQELRRYLSRA